MNREILVDFKEKQEALVATMPGCENYISAGKNIGGHLDNYDLFPVILAKTTLEVRQYVQAMTGVMPDDIMAGVMVPMYYPYNGENVLTSMIIVGYDATDDLDENLDTETKNHIIASLILHELTHAMQLQKFGIEKFQKLAFNLSAGSDKNEYVNNILEKEAYKKQNEYLASKNLDFAFGVEGIMSKLKCQIIFPTFID